MENNDQTFSVPYVVYESTQTRMERVNTRVTIALIVAVVLMFLSNMVWLWAWMQYDYVGEDTQIELDAGDGNANYIGEDGVIVNGEDKS